MNSAPRANLLALLAALAALCLARTATAALTGVPEDACGGKPQACLSCSRVVVCALLDGVHYSPVASVPCSRASPFCADGHCQQSMSPSNACEIGPKPASTFRCPADYTGYLPDPEDCSRYHYCQDGAGWDFECSVHPNTLYHHASASCVPTWSAPCFQAGCPVKPAAPKPSLVLYGADDAIAFRCAANGSASVAGVCPKYHRAEARAAQRGVLRCERFCPRDGRQPADGDPKLYYECLVSDDGSLSQPVLRTCPEGSVFDASRERCVVAADSAARSHSYPPLLRPE